MGYFIDEESAPSISTSPVMPKGFFIDETPTRADTFHQPLLDNTLGQSALDTFQNIGQSLIKGGSQLAGTVADYNPFSVEGNMRLGNAAGKAWDWAVGNEQKAPDSLEQYLAATAISPQLEKVRTENIGDAYNRNSFDRYLNKGTEMIPSAMSLNPAAVSSAFLSGVGGEAAKDLGYPEIAGQLAGGTIPGLMGSLAKKGLNAAAGSIENELIGFNPANKDRIKGFLDASGNPVSKPVTGGTQIGVKEAKVQDLRDTGFFNSIKATDTPAKVANNLSVFKQEAGKKLGDTIDEVAKIEKDLAKNLMEEKLIASKSLIGQHETLIKDVTGKVKSSLNPVKENYGRLIDDLISKRKVALAKGQKEKAASLLADIKYNKSEFDKIKTKIAQPLEDLKPTKTTLEKLKTVNKNIQGNAKQVAAGDLRFAPAGRESYFGKTKPNYSAQQQKINDIIELDPALAKRMQAKLDGIKKEWSTSKQTIADLQELKSKYGSVNKKSLNKGLLSSDDQVIQNFASETYGTIAESLNKKVSSLAELMGKPELASTFKDANKAYSAAATFETPAFNASSKFGIGGGLKDLLSVQKNLISGTAGYLIPGAAPYIAAERAASAIKNTLPVQTMKLTKGIANVMPEVMNKATLANIGIKQAGKALDASSKMPEAKSQDKKSPAKPLPVSKEVQKELSSINYTPVPAKAEPVKTIEKATVTKPLVKAVIKQESGGDHKAVGPQTKYGRAKGLMQLLDSTARDTMKEMGLNPRDWKPFDKALNEKVGTFYLDKLVKKYDGNEALALMAYNWGMGNVDEFLAGKKKFVPRETKKYVNNILNKRVFKV